MKLQIFVAMLALMLPAAAHAECPDDVCSSLQKILAARSGNFSAIKGKTGRDPRGDAIWEGMQPIAGLMNTCYIYKRGEGSQYLSHYEYHCEAPGSGATSTLPLEKAKQIAERLKAATQSANPKIVWFEDPAAGMLAGVDGFQGHTRLVRRRGQKQHRGEGGDRPVRSRRQHRGRDGLCKTLGAARSEMIGA